MSTGARKDAALFLSSVSHESTIVVDVEGTAGVVELGWAGLGIVEGRKGPQFPTTTGGRGVSNHTFGWPHERKRLVGGGNERFYLTVI